jgi:LRP1 type putative zinc finger protein
MRVPSSVLEHVSEATVADREPLFSLSHRVRTLLALRSVDRSLRDTVDRRSLPALMVSEDLVPANARGPSYRHSNDLEHLAGLTDVALRSLAYTLGHRPAGQQTRRPELITWLRASPPSRFALLPLKGALQEQRRKWMGITVAMESYHLRRSDLPQNLRPPRLDDVIDAALRRHGSSLRMAEYRHKTTMASLRRSATLALRARRTAEVEAAPQDELGDWEVGVAEANAPVSAYVRLGGEARLAAARAAIEAHVSAIRSRRVWIRAQPLHRMLVLAPAGLDLSAASDAADTYVALGTDTDRMLVETTSARVDELERAWGGAPLLEGVSGALRCPHAAAAANELVHDGDASATETLRSAWDALAGPAAALAATHNAPLAPCCPRRIPDELLAAQVRARYSSSSFSEPAALLERALAERKRAHVEGAVRSYPLCAARSEIVAAAATRAFDEQPTASAAADWTRAEVRKIDPLFDATCANPECANRPARKCPWKRCRTCCKSDDSGGVRAGGCPVH